MPPKQNKSFKKSSESDGYQWTPLLITIGPQCCGKTTFIKNMGSVIDIAIDNIPQVYEKIPLEAIQALVDNKVTAINLSLRTYNMSIGDRLKALIAKNSEDMIIAQYVFKMITEVEFESAISVGDNDLSKDLINAAKKVVKKHNFSFSTETYDLFIPEALPFAISESLLKLKESIKNKPVNESNLVSWGNTNSQIRDFTEALAAAQVSKRPVRFIRWGFEIPRVGLSELIEMNVERFLCTGKYIPVSNLKKTLLAVEEMFNTIEGRGVRHSSIAQLAGYAMDSNGHVMKGQSAYETSSVNPTKYTLWRDDTNVNTKDTTVLDATLPVKAEPIRQESEQANNEVDDEPIRQESKQAINEVDDENVIKLKDRSDPTFVPQNEKNGFNFKAISPRVVISDKNSFNDFDNDSVIQLKDHSDPTFVPKNESNGFSFSSTAPKTIHEEENIFSSNISNSTKTANSNINPFACFTTAIFCTFNNKS